MLESLAYVAQILGGVGIFIAAVTLLVHRNQLNFEVIASCTERFQKIVADLESEDHVTKARAERRYVDLCNEDLFYFQRGYLPKDVMEEWLDGMLDRLPLWKAPAAKEVHPKHRGEMGEDLFTGCSRIKRGLCCRRALRPVASWHKKRIDQPAQEKRRAEARYSPSRRTNRRVSERSGPSW